MAFDNVIPALELSNTLGKDEVVNYQIIINSGLNRFGVLPQNVVLLYKEISQCENLIFKGISTHTGQVYGVSNKEKVTDILKAEIDSMNLAKNLLKKEGADVEFVATGTTPIFKEVIKSDLITISRPGNYVFFDAIQSSKRGELFFDSFSYNNFKSTRGFIYYGLWK